MEFLLLLSLVSEWLKDECSCKCLLGAWEQAGTSLGLGRWSQPVPLAFDLTIY